MGDGYSNGTVSESLKAEREDLEKTVACVGQMARDFDTLAERRKSFDAKRVAFHLQLKGPGLRRCVWKGIITPEAFQWHQAAIARKRALGEQVLKDTAAFAEALVRWAEDLERREKSYRAKAEQQEEPALLSSPSIPIVTGRNGLMPDEVGAPDGRSIEGAVSGASAAVNSPADAPAPVLKDAGIVLGAVAGTVGDAISDAAIVFGNMAGPAKAPYNPVDTAFGYQDAFWKMLGFRSRPFGAQTSAENAQLGEAFENAMFALLGPGIFAANLPEVDTSGKYSTTIQWGILNLPVRPAGPGFWGPRFPQADPQVDAYELQVNPNNESYYLRLPDGRYAHFENLTDDTLEDAKLVKNSPSIYHVESLPPFASEEMLKKASRQLEAATPHNLKVEWIISDKAAAEQLQALFRRNNLNITVIFLQPRQPWKR